MLLHLELHCTSMLNARSTKDILGSSRPSRNSTFLLLLLLLPQLARKSTFESFGFSTKFASQHTRTLLSSTSFLNRMLTHGLPFFSSSPTQIPLSTGENLNITFQFTLCNLQSLSTLFDLIWSNDSRAVSFTSQYISRNRVNSSCSSAIPSCTTLQRISFSLACLRYLGTSPRATNSKAYAHVAHTRECFSFHFKGLYWLQGRTNKISDNYFCLF